MIDTYRQTKEVVLPKQEVLWWKYLKQNLYNKRLMIKNIMMFVFLSQCAILGGIINNDFVVFFSVFLLFFTVIFICYYIIVKIGIAFTQNPTALKCDADEREEKILKRFKLPTDVGDDW